MKQWSIGIVEKANLSGGRRGRSGYRRGAASAGSSTGEGETGTSEEEPLELSGGADADSEPTDPDGDTEEAGGGETVKGIAPGRTMEHGTEPELEIGSERCKKWRSGDEEE